MFTSFGIKFRNSKPWKKLNSPDAASLQIEILGSRMTGLNKSRKNLVQCTSYTGIYRMYSEWLWMSINLLFVCEIWLKNFLFSCWQSTTMTAFLEVYSCLFLVFYQQEKLSDLFDFFSKRLLLHCDANTPPKTWETFRVFWDLLSLYERYLVENLTMVFLMFFHGFSAYD